MKAGLRRRVTWAATGASAVVLGAGALLLFWVLDRQLTAALDDELADRARVTAAGTEAWAAEELRDLGRRPSSDQIQTLLGAVDRSAGLNDLFSPPKDVPEVLPVMTTLLGADGSVLRSSHAPQSFDLPDAALLRAVRAGTILPSGASVTDAEDRDSAFRVATAPVRIGGRVEAFVQVWAPAGSFRLPLLKVEGTLLASLAAWLLVSFFLVGASLRSALRPVDLLVDRMRGISEQNLSVRLPVPVPRDELRRLTETFNALLGRLDEAFGQQNRLFQDLSHQLKTPLAVLRGTLETSLAGARTTEDYQEALATSLHEVDRMTALINELLQLAALDARQETLRPVPVNLEELCRRWVDDVALLFEAKSLEAVWDCGGELTVAADPARLGQALLNLIDNAVKYSPEGGRISFRLRSEDGGVSLEIHNQGPPLAAGAVEAVFRRFSRKAGDPEGHGLGLSIARRLVELHGGTLTARNPASGGAAFRLWLPRTVPERTLIPD